MLNRTILDRVVRRGRVYISEAEIGAAFALGVCVINRRSTEDDVRSVVREVLAAAEEV